MWRRGLVEVLERERAGDFPAHHAAQVAGDPFAHRALQFLAHETSDDFTQHVLVDHEIVVRAPVLVLVVGRIVLALSLIHISEPTTS